MPSTPPYFLLLHPKIRWSISEWPETTAANHAQSSLSVTCHNIGWLTVRSQTIDKFATVQLRKCRTYHLSQKMSRGKVCYQPLKDFSHHLCSLEGGLAQDLDFGFLWILVHVLWIIGVWKNAFVCAGWRIWRVQWSYDRFCDRSPQISRRKLLPQRASICAIKDGIFVSRRLSLSLWHWWQLRWPPSFLSLNTQYRSAFQFVCSLLGAQRGNSRYASYRLSLHLVLTCWGRDETLCNNHSSLSILHKATMIGHSAEACMLENKCSQPLLCCDHSSLMCESAISEGINCLWSFCLHGHYSASWYLRQAWRPARHWIMDSGLRLIACMFVQASVNIWQKTVTCSVGQAHAVTSPFLWKQILCKKEWAGMSWQV